MRKILSCIVSVALLSGHAAWADSAPAPSRYEEKANAWDTRSEKAERWTFHDLPHHIHEDLKYGFFSPYHFLGLTLAIPAIAAIYEHDQAIQDRFVPRRPFGKTFDDVMNIGTHPAVLGGATLLTLGISELAHWEKTAVTSGTMLEALALSEALTMALKYTVGRTRPDGSSHSFPSAHATGAFALASVAQVHYGPWAGIPAYALATLSGLSRIDANKHFASDVATGALVGTLIGLGTAKYHKKIFSKVFLLPAYDPESEETGFKIISPF